MIINYSAYYKKKKIIIKVQAIYFFTKCRPKNVEYSHLLTNAQLLPYVFIVADYFVDRVLDEMEFEEGTGDIEPNLSQPEDLEISRTLEL